MLADGRGDGSCGAGHLSGVLTDYHLPPGLPSPAADLRRIRGVTFRSARWSAAELEALLRHLAGRGADALAALECHSIQRAWQRSVSELRDPSSPERRALESPLAHLCRLSPEGLAAGLAVVLDGVAGEPVSQLFAQASALGKASIRSPVAVLLASNLPALAVQPLVAALALRRPVLLKSPTAEPLFAPLLLDLLTRSEPRLAEALAAITWVGGDRALEEPVLAAAGRILAYGGAEMLADLEHRARGKVTAYGPKTSLAVVSQGIGGSRVTRGLARDVALFDQRGCLSVTAIYVEGDRTAASKLAGDLALELGSLSKTWPPGPPEPAVVAAVQQIRAEARMRGIERPRVANDSVAVGTVLVDPDPSFRPAPGLRTVRVHPLPDLARLAELLAPWSGRLQGVALAGERALGLISSLTALGVSWTAPPGELQAPNALWHNGGVHPLTALGAASS